MEIVVHQQIRRWTGPLAALGLCLFGLPLWAAPPSAPIPQP
jgi:hypothetical protein